MFLFGVLASCEKDIDIDIPEEEPQIVVEGSIEIDQPPVVLVSKTRGLFEPTSPDDLAGAYISNANVFVNGEALTPLCTNEIPDEFIPLLSDLLSIPPDDLDDLDICAYVGLEMEGAPETTYELRVEVEEKILSSVTHIPNPVVPDSSWFRLWANSPRYGFVFTRITDPDTLNNAYRVFTRRIGPNDNDNPNDEVFYAPFGSAFTDEFFNGDPLEIGFQRGQPANSSRPVDNGDESGFFEIGDRFVFKFCSTDQATYQFFRTFEQQLGTNGSPFAAPNNVISNIEGGLGIWAGYGCDCDTIHATP